jgi:Sec-independent protein translocase protein TatA
MLGIGLPELLFIVALLVVCFRPDQLAGLARTVGQFGGQLWRMSQGLRSEIEREVAGLEVPAPPRPDRHGEPRR